MIENCITHIFTSTALKMYYALSVLPIEYIYPL